MSKWMFLAIAFIAAINPASAESGAKEALVSELMEVTEVRQQMDEFLPKMKDMLQGMLKQSRKPGQNAEIMRKYEEQVGELFAQEFGWERMEPQFTQVYLKVFNEQELKDIIAFYRTDLGQKILKKMPAVMDETMQITQQNLRRLIPQMEVIVKKMHAELNADNESAHNK